MQPIDPTATPDLASLDPESLALVSGGFGALLGALLQAAPGILQGVSGIISAARSGGSSGAAAGPGPTPAPQQPDPSAQASAAPAGPQDPSASAGSVPRVLVIRFG